MPAIDTEALLRITNFSQSDADILDAWMSAVDAELASEAPADVDLGYYDVRNHGIVEGSAAAAAANQVAIQALFDTVKAAGGGRIHFPAGDYYIAPKSGVGEDNLASVRLRGHNNIMVTGDGRDNTRLIWHGDMALSSRYLFWIAGASLEALANITSPAPTENITFRDIWFGIGDVTNWNAGEQNHLFRVYTEKRGDVKNLAFRNCGFGVVKGDALFLNGEHNSTAGVMTYVDGVVVDGCVFDGYKYAGSNPGFGYRCCIAHQKGLKSLRYIGCRFTGSDDSLLDFEPTGGQTGTNGISGVSIVGCRFVVGSPAGAASAPECISFGGTEESEGSYLSDLVFIGNTVLGGRVRGLRVTRADVSHNSIYTDTGGAVTSAALYFIDRVESLKIVGNHIWCPSGFTGNNAIEVYNEALPANEESATTIHNNTISINGCNGIYAESCDLDIVGNRIINKSASVGAKSGIYVRATSNDSKTNIVGNTIIGNLGGGTLDHGVHLWPDDNDMQAVVSSNIIRGCVSGVRLLAPSVGGTFTPLPVVTGNSFTANTNNIALSATTVFYVAAGNEGDITLTVGGNATPEGAVTAIQGSRHVLKNGNSTTHWYKATGTTNTGWVQETMP